ncbi:MAG TPA: aldose epimerase family protein [Vicinamibacterales bacterium]|jgi:aldose 1-epimerase|nr:aldose epimerase family protein [Vicinamibacterales bacterium]
MADDIFALTGSGGLEVRAISYGAIIVSIRTPDRTGRLDDIVLGYDTTEDYVRRNPRFFGAVVGRVANRIAGGAFELDGRRYQLSTNNGPNHLHGGVKGFDKVVWNASPGADRRSVTFRRTSPDGEEGYPGTLAVSVTYTVTDRNELIVDYEATTDAATPVNLTQHTSFNLTGARRDVLEHEVSIDADRYTPIGDGLIPTGEVASVDGTPFDFRKPTAIGARIGDPHQQLQRGRGYDHNFVLNGTPAGGGGGLIRAARVMEPTTGRTLEVATTEPGMQFYSGNFLDGSLSGKSAVAYQCRWGFCLETQHFPDSPNRPDFPSTILRPGKQYRSQTVFAFGAE